MASSVYFSSILSPSSSSSSTTTDSAILSSLWSHLLSLYSTTLDSISPILPDSIASSLSLSPSPLSPSPSTSSAFSSFLSILHTTSTTTTTNQQQLPLLPPLILQSFSSLYTSLASLEKSEWASVFAPVLCYWIYSSFFYILSSLNLHPLEVRRIPTSQKGRPKNRVTVKKVIASVAIQHVVQMIVATTIAVVSRGEAGPGSMEPPILFMLKMAMGCFILDTYQYWMHRYFHTNRYLYRKFHSVHHQLTVPYAFGALYNHPVEGFLMDTIGGGMASILLDMHPWTACLFYSMATLKTVDDHCGFRLPFDPLQRLFSNNAQFHDIHHWGKGRMYNFSQPFFTFWDDFCGTTYPRSSSSTLGDSESNKGSDNEEMTDKKETGKSMSRYSSSSVVLPETRARVRARFCEIGRRALSSKEMNSSEQEITETGSKQSKSSMEESGDSGYSATDDVSESGTIDQALSADLAATSAVAFSPPPFSSSSPSSSPSPNKQSLSRSPKALLKRMMSSKSRRRE